MRHRARLALAGVLMLAAGCSVSTEREVYLKMPVSRLELPEQPARRMSSGPGFAAFERVTLTADQTTTSPDPQAPRFAHDDEELQVRLDGAVTPFVSVAGKLYGEGLGLVQLKALPLAGLAGRGPFSLAVTVGYGKSVTEEGEDFLYNADSDQYARTTLKSSLTDYGLILGWRLGEQVLVFGGPFRSRLKYNGHYFSARGSDPDVEQDFAGEVTQSGANLGLALNPARWATVLLEYASADLEGGRTEADTGRFAASIEFSFGSLLRPPPPPDEQPPVEVVPPVEQRDQGR